MSRLANDLDYGVSLQSGEEEDVAPQSEGNSAESVALQRLADHPLLTMDQEREFARIIWEGTSRRGKQVTLLPGALGSRAKSAHEELVRCNIRLVIWMAKRYVHRRHLMFFDLVQEGILGLMRAVWKYDYQHDHGARFVTYAVYFIRQAITRALVNKDDTVRLPEHLHVDMNKVMRA